VRGLRRNFLARADRGGGGFAFFRHVVVLRSFKNKN
jgi:hypothetical protein